MAAIVTENPLRAGMRLERTAEPCVVVIFGASGDLTKRKLVPALYSLAQQKLLPAEFAILGISRPVMSDDEFRARMKDALGQYGAERGVDDSVWESFASGLFYMQGEFDDAGAYERLRERLEQLDSERGTGGNHLFYLSTAPSPKAKAGRASL